MSRLVEIKVNKNNVYDDVEMATEYFGAHNVDDGGNSLYDSVAVTQYDRERLDKFWADACALLTEPFKQFIVYLKNEEGSMTVGLNMPSNFIVSFEEPIAKAVYDFVKNSILAKWFDLVYRAESEKYAVMASANLNELREKLFARKAPERAIPK